MPELTEKQEEYLRKLCQDADTLREAWDLADKAHLLIRSCNNEMLAQRGVARRLKDSITLRVEALQDAIRKMNETRDDGA